MSGPFSPSREGATGALEIETHAVLSALLTMAFTATPCGPITPATAVDPALAALYAEEGQGELERGNFEAAAVAFTLALSLDGSREGAAAARQQACLSLGERSLETVDALMDAQRWAEALAALADLSLAPPAARALLEGVCHFQLGDDDAAKVALGRAVKDPAHEADARVLLSLLALRRGSARGAEAQLRALERGGHELGGSLSSLLRQASRGGALTVRASLFGGVDSNPAFAPMGEGTPNGLLGFTGLLQVVPWGAVSPYARVAAGGREYPGLPALRTFTGVGTLGMQLGRGGDRLAVDYSLDGVLFGADPYAVTHGPRLEGSLQLGPVLVFAEWMLRFERYLPADALDFSGVRQDAGLGATAVLPAGFSVEVAWDLERDQAQKRELSMLEHGPRVSVAWMRGRVRALAGASLDWRSYDVFDADLGVQRADVRVRPSLRVEVDVADWLSLFLAGDAAVVESNAEAVRSVRFAGTGGAQVWAGAW